MVSLGDFLYICFSPITSSQRGASNVISFETCLKTTWGIVSTNSLLLYYGSAIMMMICVTWFVILIRFLFGQGFNQLSNIIKSFGMFLREWHIWLLHEMMKTCDFYWMAILYVHLSALKGSKSFENIGKIYNSQLKSLKNR